jgi:cyclic lactone autoinducer peptide
MILYFVNEVRAVALIAGNAMSSVFGVFEKFLLFAGDVAGQTACRVFSGRATKSKDRVIG